MKVVRLRKRPTTEDIKKWTADVYTYKDDNVIFVRTISTGYIYLAYQDWNPGRQTAPDFCQLATKIYRDACFNLWGHETEYNSWNISKIRNFNDIVAAIKKGTPIPVIKDCNTAETQLGVELELENKDYGITMDYARDGIVGNTLIQDVGWDSSVTNGYEYRFNHPNMQGWKISKLKPLLKALVLKGYDNLYGTAGMHVHVSGTNANIAANRARDNIATIQKILYPISGRRRLVGRPGYKEMGRYGRGSNIIKNQIDNFGTLEFRAFETTTDPYVFYWRLVVCKALFEYLAAGKPLENFFESMRPKVKQAYKSLLLHPTNPHEYGADVNTVLNWLN